MGAHPLASACLLVLLGCGAAPSFSFICNRTCACAAGQICIGQDPALPYAAACLPACQGPGDCPDGSPCVQLATEAAQPRVCWPPEAIPLCPDIPYDAGWHGCQHLQSACDGDGLLTPWYDPASEVCGLQVVSCPGRSTCRRTPDPVCVTGG